MEFQGNLTEIHHSKRIFLKSELHSIENKQAQIWHQRSRQNQNLFGDENNAFFHRMCSINQRKNLIKKIRDTNSIVQTQAFPLQRFSQIIFKAFSKGILLGKLLIDINLNWMLISLSLHSQVCGPFEENEIKNTIMSFNNGKAPSLTV